MSDNIAHAVSGALGGIVAMASTYPLITISTRAQVERKKQHVVRTPQVVSDLFIIFSQRMRPFCVSFNVKELLVSTLVSILHYLESQSRMVRNSPSCHTASV